MYATPITQRAEAATLSSSIRHPTAPTKGACARLLGFLAGVGGSQHIPDAARAARFRVAAKQLAAEKASAYSRA